MAVQIACYSLAARAVLLLAAKEEHATPSEGD